MDIGECLQITENELKPTVEYKLLMVRCHVLTLSILLRYNLWICDLYHRH